MSNDSEPRSSPDLPESERTNKPLIIECDYNTRRQNLAFDSARDCSCDELRARIKESFKLTARPFKVRWDDDDGEKNYIQDEDTLDDAIQYYHSSDGSSVTMFVKISLEYDGPSHSGASPLVGKEADSAEGPFAHGEISNPQQDVATISKDAGKSTQNTLPLSLSWEPPQSHNPNSDSCESSIDEGETGGSVIDGSTDGCSLNGSADRGDTSPVLEYLKQQEFLKRQERRDVSSSHQRSFPSGWQKAWVESQSPDPMMDALDDSRSLLSGSFSLNTDTPMSDTGFPDPGTLHQRREDYSSYRSLGPAGSSEYEAPVNGSPGSTAREPPLPQKVTCCSECDCILDGIKYVCTTCGEKTPIARAAHIEAAAAAAKGKGRNREASTSPTRTILGRSLTSSGSSSSTARAGYELCAECFVEVGVDHAWASCVNGSFSTPRELTIARRSPPKQEGQLRHAFVEQVQGPHGWIDLEQEEIARQCIICENELSTDRYKCPNGDCNNFTICRGCFSKVHDIHPIHPFLHMRAKPASQTPNHLEISDEVTTGENADESPLKHRGFQCSGCHQDIVGDLMECTKCKGIKLCSNCDVAGVFDTPESGHRSSHIMFKIPMNGDGTHDVSERAHGECHSQDVPADLGPTLDTEETCIHNETCNSCEETIVGARYLCLNCPSKYNPFNLCSDCEVKSYKVHDPKHTFLKIPRRVDIPGPLESEFPIIPILYRSPAGPRPLSNTPDDPAAYLRNLTHGFALCDQHMRHIVGKWYRCAFCAKDLCEDCEAVDAHDSTHAFIVFKAPVDEQAFRNFADEENPAGSPPVLDGNIYRPQHE